MHQRRLKLGFFGKPTRRFVPAALFLYHFSPNRCMCCWLSTKSLIGRCCWPDLTWPKSLGVSRRNDLGVFLDFVFHLHNLFHRWKNPSDFSQNCWVYTKYFRGLLLLGAATAKCIKIASYLGTSLIIHVIYCTGYISEENEFKRLFCKFTVAAEAAETSHKLKLLACRQTTINNPRLSIHTDKQTDKEVHDVTSLTGTCLSKQHVSRLRCACPDGVINSQWSNRKLI